MVYLFVDPLYIGTLLSARYAIPARRLATLMIVARFLVAVAIPTQRPGIFLISDIL